MSIKNNKVFGRISLPSKWHWKVFPDDFSERPDLSPEEQQWLNNHEHFHGSPELLAVIRGRALLCLDGRPVRLSRGEFLVINPWIRHTAGHLPDRSAIFWWCILKPGRFEILLWQRNRIDSFQILESEDFVRLLARTLSETEDPTVAAELQYFVGGLICRFIRTMTHHVPSFADRLHQETAVEKVLAWLENLPVLKCSLGEAASLSGYSPPHFQRLFKKYTGKTFYDYLQRKRLERYQNLRGKRNIIKKESAYFLGFASTAALNHWEQRIGTVAKQNPLD